MTAILLSQVKQITDFTTAGKSPWLTLSGDRSSGEVTVVGVYPNRDAARAAKNGKPLKYEEGMGFTMLDAEPDVQPDPTDIEEMRMTETNQTAEEATAQEETLPAVYNNLGSDVDDASEFAADKAAEVAVLPLSTSPIPPTSQAPTLAADKAVKVKADVRHASEIIRPTKRVWAIADAMVDAAKAAGLPLPTRKEVMAECDRQGIAFYTARTQYQVWKQMQG